MKKILLKLLLVSFIVFSSNYFAYADEKIILPQKKPVINKAQEDKNLDVNKAYSDVHQPEDEYD